jgi:two-component system sensor histidine kinase DesK
VDGMSELSIQRRSLAALSLVLLFLLEPASSVPDQDPAAPAVAGLAASALLYLALITNTLGLRPMRWVGKWMARAGLGLLAATGIGLALAYGAEPGWLLPMVVVAAAGVCTLPMPRAAIVWLLGTVVAEGVLVAQLSAQYRAEFAGQEWFWAALSTLLVGALTLNGRQTHVLIDRLHQTRAELAGAAVETERLRFARDLHDLLGHTLSLLVVKAEVAKRSARQDPDAAAREAGEIEQIGRRALAEVREAVTGYRERPFAAELDSARTALADAGVAVSVRAGGTPLPAPADDLFGWVVREAATNVVRHSGARRCEIEVSRVDGVAVLEVRDDGRGGGSQLAAPGRGLSGLSERLAGVGGELVAGADADGWHLRAVVPVALP